ncbi:MAG: hypothetical protein ABIG99_00860 [Patescibacteria group bacterium]
MKNFKKFYVVLVLIVGTFFITQNVSAAGADYQTINLNSGWNIVSTPKVLLSHQFSVAETSSNFDIYLLDPTSSSGWQTMQGAGQNEFTPLFAYFINNKTGENQTLRLNYNFDLSPAQRLFQRTLQPGWNTVGIASPSYALAQGSNSTDRNNPSNILNSITSVISQVIDFTSGNTNLDSPAITDTWLSKTASDTNNLKDFRELKGYGVFVTTLTNNYLGSQNLEIPDVVQHGTLTIEKDTSSPSVNLTLSGNDVNLGTFKITASDESIKIQTLKAGFTFTDGGTANTSATLRNGRLLIGGVQYGSTATLLADGTTFTTNYTVNPGTSVLLEVHADIYDNDGTGVLDASDTILAKIMTGSSNVQGTDSLELFNAPATAVSANTLSIALTEITLSKNSNYANQNTTLPATAFKIGSYNLAASSAEDVLLTTVTVDVTGSVGAPNFIAEDITNMYIVVKDSNGNIVAQPTPIGTVIASQNSFSINYTLPKNSNLTIDVYGNLADADNDIVAENSLYTVMQVSGTSMVSGQTVSSGVHGSNTIVGQTIAYKASTLTISKDASSPVAGIVYDNQTVTTLAAKFAAITAGYNITDLKVTLGTNANTIVQNVMLYDGATLIASGPMTTSTTAVFSGLNWNVPANTNKVLTVKLQLGTVGVGGGTTGADLTTRIITAATDFTATNTSTGVSTNSSTEESGAAAGNAMYVYAAIPTITQGTLASNTLLNTNARPLLKFTMTGNGGDISWDQLTFAIGKVSGITIGTNTADGVTLWDVTSGGNTEVGGAFTFAETETGGGGGVVYAGSGGCSSYSLQGGDIVFIPSVEQMVSGSRTYELRANIAGVTTCDHITVAMNNDQTIAVASGTVAAKLSADSDAPIIWSDMSSASHSTTTTDWVTDFGVKNLPISDTLTSPL